MRREWLWALATLIALVVGATCAEPYTRIALPYYRAVVTAIARFHPWSVVSVEVVRDPSSHSAVLQLTGEIRQHRRDPHPLALVTSSAQVGEVIETPVVFWTLLLMWPATTRASRLRFLALGIPVFLALEAVTTPIQLVDSMARATAILAGESPLTIWERWSRFLEAGGRFALETVAAFVTVALASAVSQLTNERPEHRGNTLPLFRSQHPGRLARRA
jgi:hypothetical protein